MHTELIHRSGVDCFASIRNGQRLMNFASKQHILLLMFLCIVALTGGGSRPDILSLAILRPASFLILGTCLFFVTADQLRPLKAPLILLAALAAWLCIQLIPLPPAIWQSLPGRQLYADIGAEIGMRDVWRPISLAPAKTLNSLLSLGVPAASILLFAIQPQDLRKNIPLYLIAIAVLSAILGAAQMLTKLDLLFLYRITNLGQPVGLFANQNHQSVFLASVLFLIIGLLGTLDSAAKNLVYKRLMLIVAAVLVLIISVLAGSRFGFLVAALAILSVYYLLQMHSKVMASRQGKLRLVISIAAVFLMIGIFYFFVVRNSVAFDQILGTSIENELRYNLLPALLEMAGHFIVFGIGFGAFYKVYPQWETVPNLSTNYLNNAHNDWLQLVIEGGIPACLIAVGLLVWIGARCVRLLRAGDSSAIRTAAPLVLVLMSFAGASAVDYPLRVPIIMMYITFVVCAIARHSDTRN
jgi:O-antigen ligase